MSMMPLAFSLQELSSGLFDGTLLRAYDSKGLLRKTTVIVNEQTAIDIQLFRNSLIIVKGGDLSEK